MTYNIAAFEETLPDPEAIRTAGATLKTTAGTFKTKADTASTSWAKLQSPGAYKAPGDEIVFSAFKPITTAADDLVTDIGTVQTAVNTYATAVDTIKTKLSTIKINAANFESKIAGRSRDDWDDDKDLVGQEQGIIHDLDGLFADLQGAQRDCANSINAIYGGPKYVLTSQDAAKPGEIQYGFTQDQIDSAAAEDGNKIPWGHPTTWDKPWYEDAWDGVKSFGKGVWNGITGTVTGLFDMVNVFDQKKFQATWKGLGKLALDVAIVSTPLVSTVLAATGNGKVVEDAGKELLTVGKAAIHWDDWQKDPAMAAGETTFDLATILLTAGGGAAAKVGNVAGKVSELANASGKVAEVLNATKISSAANFTVKAIDFSKTLKLNTINIVSTKVGDGTKFVLGKVGDGGSKVLEIVKGGGQKVDDVVGTVGSKGGAATHLGAHESGPGGTVPHEGTGAKPGQSGTSSHEATSAKPGEPKSGTPGAHEPKAGEPKNSDAKADEPKSGESKGDEPKADDSKNGGAKPEEPQGGDHPKADEPRPAEPKPETTETKTPQQETPSSPEPHAETPAPTEPAPDADAPQQPTPAADATPTVPHEPQPAHAPVDPHQFTYNQHATGHLEADGPRDPAYGQARPDAANLTPSMDVPHTPNSGVDNLRMDRDPAHAYGVDEHGNYLTKEEYEARYTVSYTDSQGVVLDGWRYPPNGGAVEGTIRTYTDVESFIKDFGNKFDRIGDPNGKYLAVEGTPWEMRSLPVDTLGKDMYHYELTGKLPENVRVKVSEVAPAFGQKGGGTQLVLEIKKGDTWVEASVKDLTDAKVLEKIETPEIRTASDAVDWKNGGSPAVVNHSTDVPVNNRPVAGSKSAADGAAAKVDDVASHANDGSPHTEDVHGKPEHASAHAHDGSEAKPQEVSNGMVEDHGHSTSASDGQAPETGHGADNSTDPGVTTHQTADAPNNHQSDAGTTDAAAGDNPSKPQVTGPVHEIAVGDTLFPKSDQSFAGHVDSNNNIVRPDLEPNTAYRIDGRGAFYTDGNGHVTFAECESGMKGGNGTQPTWNPELNNPGPNMTYSIDDHITATTDDLGRTSNLRADNLEFLAKDLADLRRHGANQSSMGKLGGEGYDGGHLLAAMFGGPGEKINVIPQLRMQNRNFGLSGLTGAERHALTGNSKTWYTVESDIQKLVDPKAGSAENISWDVTVEYSSDVAGAAASKVPSAYYLEVAQPGSTALKYEFSN